MSEAAEFAIDSACFCPSVLGESDSRYWSSIFVPAKMLLMSASGGIPAEIAPDFLVGLADRLAQAFAAGLRLRPIGLE